MATINFTTTANQDIVIQIEVDKENARRTAENLLLAAQTPPGTPLPMRTIPTYVQAILITAFKSWRQSQARESTEGLRDAWEDATPTQRTQARTALGL